MHPISIFFLALAMSTDAFAAAVGKGAAMRNPDLRQALRAGLIFGVIEGVTPVIGWMLGLAAATYVTSWDHWIAFVLLSLLGGRMIYAAISHKGDKYDERTDSHNFWNLATTGLATSIDAMAVGVGMAFLDVHIAVVALAIGFTTFVMVTLGIMLGRVLGKLAGKRAEIFGGVMLIAVGGVILYEHLSGPV